MIEQKGEKFISTPFKGWRGKFWWIDRSGKEKCSKIFRDVFPILSIFSFFLSLAAFYSKNTNCYCYAKWMGFAVFSIFSTHFSPPVRELLYIFLFYSTILPTPMRISSLREHCSQVRVCSLRKRKKAAFVESLNAHIVPSRGIEVRTWEWKFWWKCPRFSLV